MNMEKEVIEDNTGYYTGRWSYTETQRGGAVGGSLEVHAKNKAEAQSFVEGKLRTAGIPWKDLAIIKGLDTSLLSRERMGRYSEQLRTMFGIERSNVLAWSDIEPRPIWSSKELVPDPDAEARGLWAKFMDESSYGLSVSPFPRFAYPVVDGFPMLHIPAANVRDPERWANITSMVRDQLDYWKHSYEDRIERLSKAKPLSAEDAEELEQAKFTLKALQASDGWTYQSFVQAMLQDRKPSALDIDDFRIYRLTDGRWIPVFNLGPDQLRGDFWRRLLSIWEGPKDKRADNVRAFLDHHHQQGGKPEPFRDLVKDTIPRLRKLADKEILADKLEGWLERAGKALPKTIATNAPQPGLTIPVIARLCWCMEKSGDTDHRIVNASAANRLANRYGQTNARAGERLKQEWDRFIAADGNATLKNGKGSRASHGRRMWAAVKVELERLGQGNAAAHAEAILSDL